MICDGVIFGPLGRVSSTRNHLLITTLDNVRGRLYRLTPGDNGWTTEEITLPGLGKPESSRPKKVAEAIRNELSVLLLQRVRDPRLRDVTITGVEMSPDLKLAKVYFDVSAGHDAGQAMKGLKKAKGFFRSHLAKQMNMRYTPELIFYHDRFHKESNRLENLFREIAEERSSDEDPV